MRQNVVRGCLETRRSAGITSLRELFKQRLGLLQIGGIEPLGEPAVDRRQQRARLGRACLGRATAGRGWWRRAIPTTSPPANGLARSPADRKLPPDPERSGCAAGANRRSTDGLPAPMWRRPCARSARPRPRAPSGLHRYSLVFRGIPQIEHATNPGATRPLSVAARPERSGKLLCDRLRTAPSPKRRARFRASNPPRSQTETPAPWRPPDNALVRAAVSSGSLRRILSQASHRKA